MRAGGDNKRTTFQELFQAFLTECESGVDRDGMGSFYERRLQLGRLFQENEEVVASAILDILPRYNSYIEIGAGYGQLACWLAVEGLNVIAIERDQLRFAGLKKLHRHVAERWPDSKLAVLLATFPCEIDNAQLDNSLVISTNLIHSSSYEEEQTIIEQIAVHSDALIDTMRFCSDRNSEEEFELLDSRFASAGLIKRKTMTHRQQSGSVPSERVVWYARHS